MLDAAFIDRMWAVTMILLLLTLGPPLLSVHTRAECAPLWWRTQWRYRADRLRLTWLRHLHSNLLNLLDVRAARVILDDFCGRCAAEG